MDLAVSEQLSPLETAARKFVVNVTSAAQNMYEVRSCEITSDSFRNRTSFQAQVGLKDVFRDQVVEALQECLNKLSRKTEVLALPNFVLELPGLTLAGAQLVSTKTSEDALHIIIRFQFFLGGINNVFRPKLGFDDALNNHASHLSVRVLADLALPFLNICEAFKSGIVHSNEPMTEFTNKLKDQSEDLYFQIELLKRFVETSERSDANATFSGAPNITSIHKLATTKR